ncbi:MAG TPA: GIY-YIG nuclease family protein [Patescibacteria group bacterium]|nr:GIY-YIG nuclease family protein [Patescibacteria group bacterium]
MPFVYILQSLNNSRYYIGSTTNLARRLEEHNAGKSTYTSLTKPFILVFNQEFSSLTQARKIEMKLKSFKSKKILESIIKDGYIKTIVG